MMEQETEAPPPPMTAAEFREALKRLELRQNRFARIAGVTALTVNRWAQEFSDIPGPVRSLLREMEKPGAWRDIP